MPGPSIKGAAPWALAILVLVGGATFLLGRLSGGASASSGGVATNVPVRPGTARARAGSGRPPGPPGPAASAAAPTGDGDLTIGTLSPRGYVELPVLAKTKGFFDAEGLRVQIARKKSGGEVVRGVAEGQLGLGLTFDMSLAFDAFRAPSYVVVGTFAHGKSPMTLYARKDRGVATASDLDRKRIGVDAFASSRYFLSLLLKRHGLSEAGVTVVEMKHEELLGALSRGDVDAIADALANLHTPAWNPRNMPGLEIADLSEADLCPVQLVLVASKELVQKEPRTVEKVTRAMVHAVDFVNEHRAEAEGLIATTLAMEAARVRELSEGLTFEVSLGPALLSALDDEGRWFRSAGRSKADAGVPSYPSLVYPDALRRVLPAAVTLAP